MLCWTAFAAVAWAVATGHTSTIDSAGLLFWRDASFRPLGPDWLLEGVRDISALGGVLLRNFFAIMAVAALLEELRRSRAEAETAHLRSDATARRAAERVEDARKRLREAEALLADADRKARQGADGRGARAAAGTAAASTRMGNPDIALETAFRSEGGV